MKNLSMTKKKRAQGCMPHEKMAQGWSLLEATVNVIHETIHRLYLTQKQTDERTK